MTTDEASRILRLSKNHVQCLARDGEIKARKDGREWVFDEASVLAWKANRPHKPRQETPWRNGMVLGRQNWRCRRCSQVNTRRRECSRCGAMKQEKADVTGR